MQTQGDGSRVFSCRTIEPSPCVAKLWSPVEVEVITVLAARVPVPKNVRPQMASINMRKWLHIPYISSERESIPDCSAGFTNLVSSTDKLTPEISNLILNIEKLLNNMNTSNFFLISMEINTLFRLFFDNLLVDLNTSVQIKPDFDFTKSVAQYMKKSYAENISQSDLASIMHMSSSSFYKEFKKNFGMSFTNYLGFYRVTKAAEIYKEKPMPFSALASLVGFSDYDYFSKTFKKHLGESPARYFNKGNASK